MSQGRSGKTIVGTFNVRAATDALFYSEGCWQMIFMKRPQNLEESGRLTPSASAASPRKTAIGRNGRVGDLMATTVFLASDASGETSVSRQRLFRGLEIGRADRKNCWRRKTIASATAVFACGSGANAAISPLHGPGRTAYSGESRKFTLDPNEPGWIASGNNSRWPSRAKPR
jgi:hypothetical protein